jgi:DNA-binding NarL/FixJ family response regulator
MKRDRSSSGPDAERAGSPGHTSVFLVDDHPPIRKAITEALDSKMDLEVVGETGELAGTLDLIADTSPDVLIVDISLPDGHGLDLVKTISHEHPDVKTIVFSMYDEAVYAERALRAGARGYLMKTETLQALVETIRDVERGEISLSRSMATQILSGHRGGAEPSFAIDELTDREFQVFRLLGQGHTVQDIQDQLGLSRKTIETYRRRAKEKLGFDSVSELLQHAVQWTYIQRASHLDEAEAVPVDEIGS